MRCDDERLIAATLQDRLDAQGGTCGALTALANRNINSGQQIVDGLLSSAGATNEQKMTPVTSS